MENIAAGLLVLIVIALAWIRGQPQTATKEEQSEEEHAPLWW
jgi:hypothetical protein